MARAPRVVLVDSFSRTKSTADAFAAAGAQLVRVQSGKTVPRLFAGPVDLSAYLENIVHDGDLARTAALCAAHEPAAVVAASEPGVELADALSAQLGLLTNGTELSQARRDKYLMTETVRRAGLAAARQIRPASAGELREWHEALGGRVVVKPLRSGAGDGVHFCDTPSESAAAFAALDGVVNGFAQVNDGVVAQEYVRGTEYVVNMVSRDGRHHATDIWRTARISVNGILDFASSVHLVRRRGEVQDRLVAYAEEVLDALGIRHGPAHAEIKLTESGPVLVEVGARAGGGRLPLYVKELLGESQLDLTVDAYLAPGKFHARTGGDYPIGPYFVVVPMVSPVAGILRGYRHLDRIRKLESFHDMSIDVRPGSRIVPTVDDMTPLRVLLKHDSEETVLRDTGTLKYLDGESFYELEPGAVPMP
ncbi:ATP-grasp domain-containing protein [Streptomyces sp. PU-14G]|uniref:ATP-grasp domain-containing protein n=1 Tax=Streptomyces sp. PU-14G TaxID=2800808 RepID=UPI0034DF6A60